ncbi:MAG: hypothetical protein WBD22_03320 [Pyrinomonadaceae bacterium]
MIRWYSTGPDPVACRKGVYLRYQRRQRPGGRPRPPPRLLGFDLVATYGTANRLREVDLECERVFKVNEGRPNIADLIREGDIALIIITPLGKTSHYDEKAIRKAALRFNVPYVTTITGAEALVEAISTKKSAARISVRNLKEITAVRS